jgi:hypothetical protein
VRHALARLVAIRSPGDASLPGGASQARLEALDAWLTSAAKAHLGAAEQVDPHEALTHVVDETSAICELVGRELLGVAPPPRASERPAAQ